MRLKGLMKRTRETGIFVSIPFDAIKRVRVWRKVEEISDVSIPFDAIKR